MPPRRRQRGGRMLMPYRDAITTMPIGYVPMSGTPGQQGAGFFGDVWRGIKGGFGAVGKFAKDNHIISTAAGFIPGAGRLAAIPLRMAGLGKPRRRRAPARPRFQHIHV